MSDFIWTDVQGNEAEELAVELSRILQPAPPKEQMAFKVAALPFYADYKLFGMPVPGQPGAAIFFLRGNGEFLPLDGSNVPIYLLNQKAPVVLNRETVPAYAKFFFDLVRGKYGRFIIVEKPEDIAWLPDASEEDKERVNQLLQPLTYKSLGRDNRFMLSATVLFRNALFSTNIRVCAVAEAPGEDAEKEPGKIVGEMELTDEQLLAENLSLPEEPISLRLALE
ncbi:MAG: hypothetical protein IPI58_02225 [Alphaproteobacteria bacterium]|nr:MAG: hypothetical protein IPI58_02225 [Alphaproteobacteria bacterium]